MLRSLLYLTRGQGPLMGRLLHWVLQEQQYLVVNDIIATDTHTSLQLADRCIHISPCYWDHVHQPMSIGREIGVQRGIEPPPPNLKEGGLSPLIFKCVYFSVCLTQYKEASKLLSLRVKNSKSSWGSMPPDP